MESTRIEREPIEIRGCRVAPNPGQVLFVCNVRFTDSGRSLSAGALAQLDVSEATKEYSRSYGPLIGYGDFKLGLADGTLIPCACLPQSPGQPGPKVTISGPGGEAGWLMYVGAVQLIASVDPQARPQRLIWGGRYQ